MMSDLPQRSGACTRESHDLLKRDASSFARATANPRRFGDGLIIAECRRCQSTLAIHVSAPHGEAVTH